MNVPHAWSMGPEWRPLRRPPSRLQRTSACPKSYVLFDKFTVLKCYVVNVVEAPCSCSREDAKIKLAEQFLRFHSTFEIFRVEEDHILARPVLPKNKQGEIVKLDFLCYFTNH